MERGQAGKRPARADCEPSLHGRGQMERKKSPAPVVFVRPFGSRATPQSANAASIPQFSMVASLRSQTRLRCSLLHWAYFALLRPQGARFVRPSRLQPLCGLRLRTVLRSVCSPLQPFGPPMCGPPLLIGLTTACFRHWRRPSCAPFPFGKKEAFG